MKEELNIALIQTDLIWEEPEENRSRFSKVINSLSGNVDLIVLPEMFTTGFTMSPSKINEQEGDLSLNWMKELAASVKAAIAGSIVFKEKDKYFNRFFFVLPDQTFFTYDKKHTFTFAGEDSYYTSGTNREIVFYKGFRICPLICYDLRFPVWSRYNNDYDVLLYVANWPKPRIEAWDTLLKARAIENMSYTIGVNRLGKDANGHEYCGHSALYDPMGKQLVFSEQKEVLYASLSLNYLKETRNKFRFLNDRDDFRIC